MEKPARTELYQRRMALGITVSQMAIGLGRGWTTADVVAAEAEDAPAVSRNYYARWLDIIEQWPPAEREAQMRRAAAGERFDAPLVWPNGDSPELF